MPGIAIYAGSFDPFHIGHQSLLNDAAPLFDKLIVLVAHNQAKARRTFTVGQTFELISEFIDGRPGFDIGVLGEQGAPGKAAADLGACLLRGIRDVTDMDYERRLATFNQELFGVSTVLLFGRPEVAHVNSTAIRELIRLGLDYGRYL